ncbi:Hypothetical protein ORPV_1096 [Orpheovirus IHUMI-LCC2]|uniref:Uncharacterized protein n=1 Tax=Orpheovirus IHUMI-LCC2 TaxID=2023057 RepID=A0A2I2L675_9VIRU|nr:Hypothetical protein ORPV_1096 [Orpheovirus IHUMI-LCC2]SNW63000.1 Hypothetical protein ORPV_1096 [Orpheovirus IHUMI-LCC2]
MDHIIIKDINSKNTLLTIDEGEYKILKKHFSHFDEYKIGNILELSSKIMDGEDNLVIGIKCLLSLSYKDIIQNTVREYLRRLTYKLSICADWIFNNIKDTSKILTDRCSRLVNTPLSNIQQLKEHYEEKRRQYEYKLLHPIQLNENDIINTINLLHRYSGCIISDLLGYLLCMLPKTYKNNAISNKLYNIINYHHDVETLGDILHNIIYDSPNNIIWRENINLKCIYNSKEGFVGLGSETFYYNVREEDGIIVKKSKGIGYMNYMTSYIGEKEKCYANSDYLQFEYDDRLFVLNEEHSNTSYYIFDGFLYVAKINTVTISKIPLSYIKCHLLDIPLYYYHGWLNNNFNITLEL